MGPRDDPVVALLERLGPDRIRPADQHGVVGDLREGDPRERAEDQTIVDEGRGLRDAPAVEPPDHEHPQDDLPGGRAAAVDGRQRGAAGQVGPDAGEDFVIVEEPIELGQLGLELQVELRDQGEPVDRIGAVAEHRGGLRATPREPSAGLVRVYRTPKMRSISHHKLVLLR